MGMELNQHGKIRLMQVTETINGGIGIDLGIKDLAICSNGKVYKNINKTIRVQKLEKKLRREQRSLSSKYKNLKKEGWCNCY